MKPDKALHGRRQNKNTAEKINVLKMACSNAHSKAAKERLTIGSGDWRRPN
jgi:hypothetical protein